MRSVATLLARAMSLLGAAAGFAATTGVNNIYIGYTVEGVAGESNACYIGSIFNQLASGGTQVFVNTNGKLGTASFLSTL